MQYINMAMTAVGNPTAQFHDGALHSHRGFGFYLFLWMYGP